MLYELMCRYMFNANCSNIQSADHEHALSIVNGWRPDNQARWHPLMSDLITQCMLPEPRDRPEFSEIVHILEDIQASGGLSFDPPNVTAIENTCQCAIQ